MYSHLPKSEIINHDAAHVLAAAIAELYPQAKFASGPGSEEGFHYDIDLGDMRLRAEDLLIVEERMHALIAAAAPFVRREVALSDARELLADQPYKLRILDRLQAEGIAEVSLYRNGDFEDLCRGPHSAGVGALGAVKLLGVGGVQGHDGAALQRVHGVAFAEQAELERYLAAREQALARDHRVVGPQLGLFCFVEQAPGMPLWLDGGLAIMQALRACLSELLVARDYQLIESPALMRDELWQASGHVGHYAEKMYLFGGEGLKPMNCPGACLAFASAPRSHAQLPLRLAEFGRVYRREQAGELHGLLRVRSFVQDDAHIFCAEPQLVDEVAVICADIARLYEALGFEQWHVELSGRPAKSMGSDEQWQAAEQALSAALEREGIACVQRPGEGAFYGPKLDFFVRDSLGRPWQCGSVQVDFQLAANLGVSYQGADNRRHHPIVIHRALLGSLERIVGILIEHHDGRLPLWLAPIQARVLAVGPEQSAEAHELARRLRAAGMRADVPDASQRFGKRVHAARQDRVPLVLVIGAAEQRAGAVLVQRAVGSRELMDVERAVAGLAEQAAAPALAKGDR